ncbi:hypothetical protein FA13DRAFT_1731893 [Coprinellus micaceus]|uniref:Uncharacterized protein n=1 Tax=Coprinellus micaceus TaxID=71717 RepID=A0A4Y7TDD5_COPMI|nr:hypothetical protein FA13DRAFT_1731893 [Coprinellus micaceus]
MARFVVIVVEGGTDLRERSCRFPIAAQTALRGLLPGTFDNIRPSVVYVTRITEKHFHGSALLLLKLGVWFETAPRPSVHMRRTEDQPDLA